MQAFRETLLNAMEDGEAFNPEQVVEVTAVRTSRSIVFYVRDPGSRDESGSVELTFATPRKLGSDLGQLMSENRVKLCSETQNQAERIGTLDRRFVEEKRRNEKN